MGAFRDRLNQALQKEDLLKEISRSPLLTGIDFIDYLNGTVVEDENGERTFEKGLNQGKMATFVGPSGSGKTTNAIQAAVNILKQDDDAILYIFDAEKSNSHKRCRMLLGISQEEYNSEWKDNRIFIINTLTTTESLQQLIDRIYANKLEIGAGFKMTASDGRFSAEGIKKAREIRNAATSFPPSIIIIDSLAVLAPMEYSGKADSTNQRDGMANAQIAKSNNALIKGSIEKCFEGNIMLFVINHIQTLINTNMYSGDKRVLKFLKMDETIPGGAAAIYLSDFTLRLDQGAKIDPEKSPFGIKGFMQKVTLVKSRSNAAGIDAEVVFDQYKGINNVLTNFLQLKNAGKIGGAGVGLFLKSYPDVKFKQSELEDLYNSDDEFREIFDKEACEIYENMIMELARLGEEDSSNKSKKRNSPEEDYDDDTDSSDEEEITVEDLVSYVEEAKTNTSLKKICKEYGLEVDSVIFTKPINISKKKVLRYIEENF